MYHGALFDARASVIQPLDYARGLARAAADMGVRIHEKTAAIHIERDDIWQVTTGDGHVRASKLLIATNAYNDLTSATRVWETSMCRIFSVLVRNWRSVILTRFYPIIMGVGIPL